ncbi:MAG: cytidine deaminase [Bacteroidales bacterium]|nr:cytidine deaminase [Bacteroidales bacterium]
MKQQSHITYETFPDWEALSPEERQLLQEALTAAGKAYAPYSGFAVGACVRLEDGTLVRGNNQENASYPQGLCAERVALFAASAIHPGKRITGIALVAPASPTPLSPCGGCRQVLLEYEQRQQSPIPVLMGSVNGPVLRVAQAADLLPFCFSKENLTADAPERQ